MGNNRVSCLRKFYAMFIKMQSDTVMLLFCGCSNLRFNEVKNIVLFETRLTGYGILFFSALRFIPYTAG